MELRFTNFTEALLRGVVFRTNCRYIETQIQIRKIQIRITYRTGNICYSVGLGLFPTERKTKLNSGTKW